MKVLHLTLKKKWFDMIASGEKKEEYREIKPYWKNRLHPVHKIFGHRNEDSFIQFDAVHFTNGYSKDAPSLTIKCNGIEIGYGHERWGGGYKQVFVIKLGDILTPHP